MFKSVFADISDTLYPYKFSAAIGIHELHGGTPRDPKIIEGWLRSRLVPDKAEQFADAVMTVIEQTGATADDAADQVAASKVNGFKSDANGLYMEGRHVKATIKENASIAVQSGDLAKTGYGKASDKGKALSSFLPEHVFVTEDTLTIHREDGSPVTEPDDIDVRFIAKMTAKGPISAIQAEELIRDCVLEFNVESDWDFGDKWWSTVWAKAEHNGIGAARSQGFGTFKVIRWDRI